MRSLSSTWCVDPVAAGDRCSGVRNQIVDGMGAPTTTRTVRRSPTRSSPPAKSPGSFPAAVTIDVWDVAGGLRALVARRWPRPKHLADGDLIPADLIKVR